MSHTDEGGADRDLTQGAARGLVRRQFVIGASAVTTATVLEAAQLARAAAVKGGAQFGPAVATPNTAAFAITTRPDASIVVRRREDFLLLGFDFYNLHRVKQKLVRVHSGRPGYLVVTFVPQYLSEQAFFDPPPTGAKLPGQARTRLAYPSRLAFVVPKAGLPYTIDGLLDWAALQPRLVPAAAYAARGTRATSKPTPSKTPSPTAQNPSALQLKKAPKLRKPTPTETAIEMPWHLVLSPTGSGRWSHPTAPVSLAGYTELWHTRLAASADPLASPEGGPFRAVWNYDLRKKAPKKGKPTLDHTAYPQSSESSDPFLLSTSPADRWQIVKASSDFAVTGRADVQARRMWLTSRGGFLDSRGFWDSLPASKYKLQEWRHIATQGRDQFVKLVYRGYLFPFGHRALQILITERRFEKVTQGGKSKIVATLRQHTYVVVKQPVKSYAAGATFGIVNDSRDLPFRSIEIKTQQTPDLEKPSLHRFGSPGSDDVFRMVVNGKDFPFHCVGTDWIGRQIEFTTPAVFVSQPEALAETYSGAPGAKAVRDAYNALSPDDPLCVAQVGGAKVAVAKPDQPGDTDLDLQSITFGARAGAALGDAPYIGALQPQFYPVLRQTAGRLSSAERASGGSPLDKTPVLTFHGPYISGEFGVANPGHVFLEVVPASRPMLNFGGGSGGGMLTPNIQVTCITRRLGPSGGTPAQIGQGQYKATDVFPSPSEALAAKILGGVKIIELIADRIFTSDPDAALKITDKIEGTHYITYVKWVPDIKDDHPIIQKIAGQEPKFKFEIDATIDADVAHPEKSTYLVDGDLRKFVVSLMSSSDSDGFIKITFDKLHFFSATGKKSTVDVKIADVKFVGPLAFIEKLQELLDFSGDGGPKIEVTPSEIRATLLVALPSVSAGALTLSNISIASGFNLPFDGSPARFRFGFATREKPFTLSVGIFGGDGYFGLAIGTDGVELIEVSLEFGIVCSVDLGIASGSVHVTAGIYFSFGQNSDGKDTVVLKGFFKMGGSLSILGLITMSLEFDLVLTYEGPDPGTVTGTATLTVSFSILCFSFSDSVSVEKVFTGDQAPGADHRLGRGGTGAPPRFIDQIPPDAPNGTTSTVWNTYCDAFAIV